MPRLVREVKEWLSRQAAKLTAQLELRVHPYIAGVNPRVHPGTVLNQRKRTLIAEPLLSPVSQK